MNARLSRALQERKPVTRLEQPFAGPDPFANNRPTRSHQRTGYVGSMANWSGTPRMLSDLQGWMPRDTESSTVWKVCYALLIGMLIGMALAGGIR